MGLFGRGDNMGDIRGYLTVKQTAKKLDISEEGVRDLIKSMEMRAYKIGKWRINPMDLQEFIQKRSNTYQEV